MSDRVRVSLSLQRGVLEGQLARCKALAGVFCACAVVVLIGEGVLRLVAGGSWIPRAIVPFVLGLALQQLLLAWFVQRRLDGDREISPEFWMASGFIEITILSCMIWETAASIVTPAYALQSPAVYTYFIFIMLSTLHLQPRISAFTGAVAALEFFTLMVLLLGWPHGNPGLPLLLGAALPNLVKVLLVLGAGMGAALIARELRRNFERANTASRARDRMEETDRAKSTFLAHMSHEIRAPLNAVLGYAELLKRDEALSPEQRRAVTTIGLSGEHLLAVINQVLDLARIEAGLHDLNVRPFELTTLMREVSALFEFRCRQKGIGFAVRLEPDISTGGSVSQRVVGDVDRLRQVLINLLDNAVRATATGEVRVDVSSAGRRVRFNVIDTGDGIPSELRGRLFEPFQQVSPRHSEGSTGLGLAIARAQTQLLGGTLVLASTSDAGSTFTLDVPLCEAPAGEAASPRQTDDGEPAMRLAPDSHVRALVVDDMDADRDVLAGMLELFGVTVTRASTAEQALAALSDAQPHILFTDVRMPDVDGPALLALARSAGLGSECRTIAVSASALEHERGDILAAGFDHFIAKPVRMVDLSDCLSHVPCVRFDGEAATGFPPGLMRPAGGSAAGAQPVGAQPLPRDLWLQLRAAAEAYSITDLKAAITQLEHSHPETHALAADLQALSRAYDMERIVGVLDQVPHV